jgi:hypothetical protein
LRTRFLRWRRSWRGLEGKRITLFERANVLFRLNAVGADHDQVRFQQSHSFRDELNQRSGSVGGDARIHRVLEDVRQLAGNFREQREPIRSRRPGQRVRRNVQALHVFRARVRILQNAGVLAQELQALRCFLKEDLYEFLALTVQTFSCATTGRARLAGFW